METKLKCSNCGTEISNLNIGSSEKPWFSLLSFIPFIILMLCIPFITQFMMKDNSDFRTDLKVKNIESNYNNKIIEIIGIIENNGKVDWENVKVEIEFFDKNGKFIDELSRKVSSNLPSKNSEYFKISSKNFPKERWESIKTVKAKVSDAYHSRY